jgi:putative transposase
MGRPRKLFDERGAEARMLEVAVRKVFKIRTSHNRIHMYLKAAGLAHEDAKKKIEKSMRGLILYNIVLILYKLNY